MERHYRCRWWYRASVVPFSTAFAISAIHPAGRGFWHRTDELGFVEITSQELAAEVRTIIHDAQIESTTINPEYGSWNLRVRKGKLDMEYIWLGPDGFGGMDHARPMTPDDTPFDLVDEVFQSVDEALEYLRKLARKYDCTIPPNQPFT